jgi:hypothetical protein
MIFRIILFDALNYHDAKKKKPYRTGIQPSKDFLSISSPELKAQVSYSDCWLSVVRLSVSPSVCKLSHFRLLLQNHWANFNQTWHRSSFGEGFQVYLNEEDRFSPRGDTCNSERVKIH